MYLLIIKNLNYIVNACIITMHGYIYAKEVTRYIHMRDSP